MSTPITGAYQEKRLHKFFPKSTRKLLLFRTNSTPHLDPMQAGETKCGLVGYFDRVVVTFVRIMPLLPAEAQ